ncbi:MAG: ABC-F family ATP-binding cassette domain-containing protein [Bacillota bacterium]|nr:ABC-F family ATP-binding cassette domain-containing protein [Bacillota bacterium]
MNLLTAENLSKSYSEKVLFDNISFGINEGDKIGVIGVNGTGKSTLLKIISGAEYMDSGKITKVNGARIEYLPQMPVFYEDITVIEQIFKGNSPVMKLIREYEEILNDLNINPENEELQKRLLGVNQKMDAANAWQIESEAKTILNVLGITDYNAKVGILSGGQRKRIALAGALINPSDLLILDEPTNHMDNETISWLEQFLNKRKGSLLMITHDRYFLDRVTNRIIELDKGKLYSYDGNYSVFLEKKVEREALSQASQEKLDNLLRRELAWIRRGAKARTTKQKARIDRFEVLNEEKVEVKNEKIDISVASSRLGKKIMELQHIIKTYGDKKLIQDFSYIATRDDRVGIIGPNGSGKSTLLNIITEKVICDSGTLQIGDTVKIGYFSQESKELNPNLRVIEYIKEAAEFIETSDGAKISASQMLERFIFDGSMQWTPISKLSGGEKRRLYLLGVLMTAPNVLLLDEPTNDLDIETLTILEDYIDEFNGTVIAVSHDRYFLDRIANKIFSFEGNGVISYYTGNYSDYKEQKEQKEKSNEENNNKVNKKSDTVENTKTKVLKFTFKEQKEYDEIDEKIQETEFKLAELDSKLDEASSNYELLQKLLAEKADLEKQYEFIMERWVYLNELAEKINNNKNVKTSD